MEIQYTPLADRLLDTLAADRTNTSARSASLNTNILLAADLFNRFEGSILTANYGFEGYMGIPGMDGTDSNARDIAFANNVAWQNLGNVTATSQRAYTSAVSTDNVASIYETTVEKGDNIPVVFSWPLLPATTDPTDFRVTRNDGVVVTPSIASFLPNSEYNERQTVVITGDFGNREQPGSEGAIYPVSVEIVPDATPLEVVGPQGPVSAVGLAVESGHPYVEGNGPRILAAKLNRFSDLGEGAPLWLVSNQNNSGSDLYGDRALFRLRIYTSAGFSPDGVASLLPTEYPRYFRLQAEDGAGNLIPLTQTGRDYEIAGFGSLRIEGLADLAGRQPSYDLTYVEDHDNYYDVILSGDEAAVRRIAQVELPSGGDYTPVYNPGGPGNDPENGPPGPFTVPSVAQAIAVDDAIATGASVSYVEVDGPVMRDPLLGTPIGENRGLAVRDVNSGSEIFQYVDPDGKVFYASFPAASPQANDLTSAIADPAAIDLIDTRTLPSGESFAVSGSYSREAGFNSDMGFYRLVDATGAVRDPLTGNLLTPGQGGYVEAALDDSNRLDTTLSAENFQTKSFAFEIPGGELYAPFLQVNSEGSADFDRVYFPFAAANSDGLNHAARFGPNVIGFEDLEGGGDRDFDDIILRFSIRESSL